MRVQAARRGARRAEAWPSHPSPRLRPVHPTWTHRHPVLFLAAFVAASEAAGLVGALAHAA